MGLITDTLVSDLSTSLLGKFKSICKQLPGYESITKTINFDTINTDIKEIIETSFSIALRSSVFEDVPQQILRESVYANIDILVEWLYQIPMPLYESEKIVIIDESFKEKIEQLFKSLHEQFSVNRSSYVSFSSEHIKKILTVQRNVSI